MPASPLVSVQSKAYEGSRALQQLDGDGSIAVYAARVVAKNPDGTAAVKEGADSGPLGTLTGTAVGSLVGLLGGPVGVSLGAASGSLIGAIADIDNVRVGSDFLANVAETLTPGKVAVVAEVDEEWTTPVDTRMERWVVLFCVAAFGKSRILRMSGTSHRSRQTSLR